MNIFKANKTHRHDDLLNAKSFYHDLIFNIIIIIILVISICSLSSIYLQKKQQRGRERGFAIMFLFLSAFSFEIRGSVSKSEYFLLWIGILA